MVQKVQATVNGFMFVNGRVLLAYINDIIKEITLKLKSLQEKLGLAIHEEKSI